MSPLPEATASEPIKIGLMTSTVGRYAGMGSEQKEGALMAIDFINERGGINGRKLKAVFVDDEGDPQKAAMLARKLIGEDKVVAIAGPTSVAATHAVGEIVVDSRCHTGVSGVFACGDVTDVPFKQVIVAAGEGAKAALAAYDYIINQR